MAKPSARATAAGPPGLDLTRVTGTREGRRIKQTAAGTAAWDHWGPYLSDRAWGTVREDYSPGGTAWDYFPHDHARSRVYRWNEDGLFGISDQHQHICFALCLWNRRDPILKERLFGLNNGEGNHGEDVKECYFYLDNVPTHSYMKALYKYPQAAYPYGELVAENRRRGRSQPEYELPDTGVFAEGRYWDVLVEYAKASPEDVLIQITVTNRGPEEAPLDLLPTVWFRNRWSWDAGAARPHLAAASQGGRPAIVLDDPGESRRYLYRQPDAELLFTENETNFARVFGTANPSPWVKDAFHERRDPRPARRRQPRQARHQGGGASPAARARGGERARAPSPHRPAERRRSARRRLRHRAVRAREGRRRVLRDGHPARALGRRRQRHAPGAGRAALVEAVLSLRRPALARGRSDGARAARRALAGPQPRLDAPLRRRRHLDAGQVGVPVVCGLGPGLSLRDAGHRRCALRQGAAPAPAARVVHAPERADARVRVGLRRREPAALRMGGAARLPDRAPADGRRRPAIPPPGLSQAPAQLHLVGEPEGRPGQQYLPGGLPRPRQYRHLRPVRPASPGRDPRPVRRHELDGRLLRQPLSHRHRARRRRPDLRGPGAEVLRAFPRHRPCHEPSRPGRHEPLGRGGRLLLRRGPAGRRRAAPDQGALARRADPAPRDRGRGRRRRSTGCRSSRRACGGCARTARTSPRTSAPCSSAASSAACSPPW